MTTSTSRAGLPAQRAPDRSANEILRVSRTLVDPALRAAIDSLNPSMRHIAGYHLGWWDTDGERWQGDPGKAVRPALVLLTASAAGAPAVSGAALPAAVAVELVHNFSLLHDDVMDGDRMRRHRPAVWSVFGIGNALLAGDALAALASRVLAESAHPAAGEAVRQLNTAVLTLVEGQTEDMDFEQRDDVTVEECVRMAEHKTAALLECCCALGALFGGAEREQAKLLGAFGRDVGLAFQYVDDLLGIWGDPASTGKPVFSDLRNRKKSLPVVAALRSDTTDGRELKLLYRRPTALEPAELTRAAALIEAAGARKWCEDRINALLARALGNLSAARPTPIAEAELDSLARLMTRRDR